MNEFFSTYPFLIEKKIAITRVILFEKCRQYDAEKNGLKYWYNKNGDIIRIDNNDYSLDMRYYIGSKGKSYLETGYIYANYVAVPSNPIVFDDDFVPKTIQSRYSHKTINTSYYKNITI